MREKVNRLRAVTVAVPVAIAVGGAMVLPANAQISAEDANVNIQSYLSKEDPQKSNAVQEAFNDLNLPEGVSLERVDWISDNYVALFIRSAAMPDQLQQVQVQVARDWFAQPDANFASVWALDGMRATDVENEWTSMTNILGFFEDKNVNVIIPVGGEASFYTDWNEPNNGKNYQYETFFTEELMPILRQVFRSDNRNAIFGPSMGGTAAMNLAAHYPHLFQAVGSFSGYLDTTTTGMPGAIAAAMDQVGGYDATAMWGEYSNARWYDNDPKLNLDKLSDKVLYVSAGSGIEDYGQEGSVATRSSNTAGQGLEVLSRMTTQTFIKKAQNEGVNVITALRDSGVHDWAYWYFELTQAWPYFAQALGLSDEDNAAHCVVEGDIAVAATDFFGECLTNEYVPLTREDARVQDFVNGRFYWSEETQAHGVHGIIGAAYTQLGGADSWLGLPTSDENNIGFLGTGRSQDFEHGVIAWSPALGAFAVPEKLADAWTKAGGATGALGYPVDEAVEFDGTVVQRFENGYIVENGEDAFVLQGIIAEKYQELGVYDSKLGLPVSNEITISGGVVQRFENGHIYWSPADGAHVIYFGKIFDAWAEQGYETGELGWPVSDQEEVDGVEQIAFQNGIIKLDGDNVEVVAN